MFFFFLILCIISTVIGYVYATGRYSVSLKLNITPAQISTEKNQCTNTKTVFFFSHHKTGVILSSKFRGLFVDIDTSNTLYGRAKFDKFTKIYKQYKKSLSNLIIFHFIREPLETIVSGFNYHRCCKCTAAIDPWICTKPITVAQNPTPRIKIIEIHNITKINSMQQMYTLEKKYRTLNVTECYQLHYLNVSKSIIDNKQLHFNFAAQHHFGIADWYNVNETNGLFLEFVRYFNCEWPDLYLMMKLFKIYFQNYYEFTMESFLESETFDKNVQTMINANCYWYSNKSQQQLMIDRSRTLDMNRNINIINDLHITRFKHNVTEQKIKLLLMDINVCLIIKQMTLLTGYEWKYLSFC
eukprot:490055_1